MAETMDNTDSAVASGGIGRATLKDGVYIAEAGVVGSRWLGWVLWVKHLLGLDRAIAFTVLARVTQILGSTGTVLLILRFLTPVEQGYYYTLLSLVSLQVIFELGFSFVILQMAAHECAHLTLHRDGRVEGDPVAHARLASILQKTLRWYLVAAVILCVSLLPVGAYFFSRHDHASAPVAWHGPWTLAVFAVSSSFLMTPLYSFFDGCKYVWQVARARMYQSCLVLVAAWAAIASHHGLYAPACVNFAAVFVGACFLFRRRAIIGALLRFRAGQNHISWRHEIWPFQWKIAVSWFCSYFMVQVLTPILFAYRGPAEAGRMGLSLSIVGYLPILVLSWVTPKATPFGQLVKLREFQRLDSIFFRTLKQSFALMVLLSAVCLAAVIAVQQVFPKLATRMETPPTFLLLLSSAVGTFLVQAIAVYLRSFKREPYLLLSTTVAGLTLLGALVAAPRWGNPGVAVVYFLFSGVLAVLWAALIFHRQRSLRIADASAI